MDNQASLAHGSRVHPVSGNAHRAGDDVFASATIRAPHGQITFRWERMTGLACLILDFTCWVALHGAVDLVRATGDFGWGGLFSTIVVLQFAALALTFYIIGGYDRQTNFVSLGYMSEHFIAVTAAAAIGAVAIYAGAAFGESIRPSRAVFLISLSLFAPASLVYRRAICVRIRAGLAGKFFVLLGAGDLARTFYQAYRASPTQQKVRVVDPQLGAPRAGQSIEPNDAEAPVIEAVSADEMGLFIANSHGVIVAERKRDLSPAVMTWLSRVHFAETPVYTLDAFYEKHWRIVPVHALDPMWPLEVSSQLASQSAYSHVKRLFDILVSAIGMALLSPIFALLTLLTWLDSGKPALFRQTRIGRDSQSFTIYKFRTMHNRPVDAQGDLYTQRKDPRVTKVGFWLRKLRLDELPQLWNVLKGEMSLMGPRAEWNQLAAQYERAIPYYHFRHLVKPGITGWAQVNYPYGASCQDAIEKLKYDLYYIRHCSLRLDAMIVLKTLHIMIWGKGH